MQPTSTFLRRALTVLPVVFGCVLLLGLVRDEFYYVHLEMGEGDPIDSGTFELKVYRLKNFRPVASFVGKREGRLDPVKQFWADDFNRDNVIDVAFVEQDPKQKKSRLRLFQIKLVDWKAGKATFKELAIRGLASKNPPTKGYTGDDRYFTNYDQAMLWRQVAVRNEAEQPSNYRLVIESTGAFWEPGDPNDPPTPKDADRFMTSPASYNRYNYLSKGGFYMHLGSGEGEPYSKGSYTLSVYDGKTHRKIAVQKATRNGMLEQFWMGNFDKAKRKQNSIGEIALSVRTVGSGAITLHAYKLFEGDDGVSLRRLADPYYVTTSNTSVRLKKPPRIDIVHADCRQDYGAGQDSPIYISYPLFRDRPKSVRVRFRLQFDEAGNPYWFDFENVYKPIKRVRKRSGPSGP